MNSGRLTLSELGLKVHDPTRSGDKAERGRIEEGFVFLGYQIQRGLIQPSKKSRTKFMNNLDETIQEGRKNIERALKVKFRKSSSFCYVQTLRKIDDITCGWGESFSFSNSELTMKDMDRKIDKKIEQFKIYFNRRMYNIDCDQKRRVLGVTLLRDMPRKTPDYLIDRLT